MAPLRTRLSNNGDNRASRLLRPDHTFIHPNPMSLLPSPLQCAVGPGEHGFEQHLRAGFGFVGFDAFCLVV